MQNDEAKRTVWIRYVDEPRNSDVWEIAAPTASGHIVPLAWFDSPDNRPHMGHLRSDQIQTAEELTQTAAVYFTESPLVRAYSDRELSDARFLSAMAGDPYPGIDYLAESRKEWCSVIAEEIEP